MNFRLCIGFPWVALAILLALLPQKAHACSCVVPGPPTEALSQASAVFSATVAGIDFPVNSGSSVDPVRVTFRVNRVWKGPVSRHLTAETRISGASCGYGFQMHRNYIVYAYGDGYDLEVSLCSRTRTLDKAEEDLATLGMGQVPPSRIYLPQMQATSCADCLPDALRP